MTARFGVALFLLLSSLFTQSANARADQRRRVIVIPTELGGFFMSRDEYRREVNLALEERLRAAQFVVTARSLLSSTEAQCRGFDCLAHIGEAHGASIVVAGRIVSNQDVTVSYHLHVGLVERVNGQFVSREREGDCHNCTEPQARDQLTTLMSAVIANEPAKVSSLPPASPPSREPKTAPAPPTRPMEFMLPLTSQLVTRDRFSHGQRLALRVSGIILATAGVGLLAQGFIERGHDGDTVVQSGQRYRIDTTSTGQPLFFSLSAACLAGGAVLTLLGWLPWSVGVSTVMSSSRAQAQLVWSF
jgi:hypothetical protein